MTDWVAPGGDEEPGSRRGVEPDAAVPGSTPAPSRPGAVADSLPPPPLPMRPMTVSDLLDGSFAIMRRRPGDVLTLAVAFVVPVEVVSTILLRDVLGAEGFAGFADPSAAFGSGEAEAAPGTDAGLISLAVSSLSLALLAGALGVLVDAWYRGERQSAGDAAVVALRRSWALLLAAVLVKLLEGVGFFAVGLGALFAMALCHVASPAVTVEGLGPVAAIGRSMSLTRRRLGTSLLVPILVGFVGLMVGSGFQALPEIVVPLLTEDWRWLARAVGQVVAQLVVVPFTAGVAVLYHLDLRIRLEGHDLERRADELLPV